MKVWKYSGEQQLTTTGEVQELLEREGLHMDLKFRRTGEGLLKGLEDYRVRGRSHYSEEETFRKRSS